MGSGVEVRRVEEVSPPSFFEYLDSVLSSPPFDTSPRRAELLRHLVTRSLASEGDSLTEYAIALDVFRKPESFDQRIDSSVRSEISRLRKMVATYYEGAGLTDPWRIVFPSRGYILQVYEIEPPAAAQAEPAPTTADTSRLAAAPSGALVPGTQRPESQRRDPSRIDRRRIDPELVAFQKRDRSNSTRWVAISSSSLVLVLAVILYITWLHSNHGAALPGDPGAKSPAHTPAPVAQAEYLKGQYFWEHRTKGSLQKAADAYTQAIVADSDYAPAYAGLAESYDLMPEYSAMSQVSAFNRAIAAANKAIALDPSNSVAHRALAFGLFWSQTDIPRALAEFQRALELAPNDSEAHHWYATALNATENYAAAGRQIDLAQQLAPASRSILADQAWVRYSSGDQQAKAALEDLEAAEPDFASPPAFLMRIDLAHGDYAGYLKQLRQIAGLSGSSDDRRIAAAAQRGWVSGRENGMLRAIQSVQKDLLSKGESDGYDLAHTCGLLNEKEDSVKYLQQAFAARDMFVLDALRPDWAPLLNGYPPLESLRASIRQHFQVEPQHLPQSGERS